MLQGSVNTRQTEICSSNNEGHLPGLVSLLSHLGFITLIWFLLLLLYCCCSFVVLLEQFNFSCLLPEAIKNETVVVYCCGSLNLGM